MSYTPKNNFNLQIKRTGTGEVGFRKKLWKTLAGTCDALDYYFRWEPLYESFYRSDSRQIEVSGGVGDFAWSIVGAGFSLGAPTTVDRINTALTDGTVVTGDEAIVTVVDSCGNSVEGFLKACYKIPIPCCLKSDYRFYTEQTAGLILTTDEYEYFRVKEGCLFIQWTADDPLLILDYSIIWNIKVTRPKGAALSGVVTATDDCGTPVNINYTVQIYCYRTGLNSNYYYLGTGGGYVYYQNWITEAPSDEILMIAPGIEHTHIIMADGLLQAAGRNDYGEYGGNVPWGGYFQNIGTDTWSWISHGPNTTYGIKTDGTLWSCGRCVNGSLGIGVTSGNYSDFVQVGTDTDWIKVHGGDTMFVAMKADGSLWSAGDASSGATGAGAGGNHRNSPIRMQILIGADLFDFESKDFCVGREFTKVLLKSGAMYLCGREVTYSHGLATSSIIYDLTQVGGLTSWDSLALTHWSTYHDLAFKDDGTLWAVGRNLEGQLGLGHQNVTNSYTQVPSGSEWQGDQVSVGGDFTLILKSDAVLYGSGYKKYMGIDGAAGGYYTTFTGIHIETYYAVAGYGTSWIRSANEDYI